MIRRTSLALSLLLVAAGLASAQDAPAPGAGPAAPPAAGGPAAPAPGPAPKPAPPPTLEQAADAVLAAVAAKDDAVLQALAAKDDPDPWLVADELVRRGQHDAAEAFAKAAPRVDTEALPAYVASRRGKPDDPARRERIATASSALAAGRPAEAVEVLKPDETGPIDDAVGVRLAMARGLALRSLVRLDASAVALRAAGAAAERLGWLARAQRAFQESGVSAYRGSDAVIAREAWERALSLCERRADEVSAALTLVNIGAVHQRLGDAATALTTYERALAAQESLGDEAGAALTLGNIGNIHRQRGDYAKALSIYGRVLAVQEARGDPAGAAWVLGSIGIVHDLLGDHAKALSFHERALAAQESLGDRVGAARTLGNLGSAHLGLGDYARAIAFLERALAAHEALGDKVGAALVLGSIGSVHLERGDYAEALSFQERSLTAQEALGARAGAAQTLCNIGNVHRRRGDFAKALSIYERALAALEALGDRAGTAQTLCNVGNVHLALGEHAKALAVYERALAGHEALGNEAEAAALLGNLGIVYSALGDHAKALRFHERALAAQERAGRKAAAARTLGNLGAVHASLGDDATALAMYERAFEAQEALGDKGGAALTLGNIGNIHFARGDRAQALTIYERALAAQEASGDKAGAAVTLGNIGGVHLALGDVAKASSFLERAARSARRLRAAPVLVDALKRLASLHLSQRAYGRALSTAQQALRESETLLGGLSDEEGSVARAQQTPLFEVGALAAVREGDLGEAFAFLENGRAGALLDALDKRDVLRWKAESLSPELRAAEAKARADEKRARTAHEKALVGGDRSAIVSAGRALDDALEDARAVHARIQRETKRAAGLFYPRARTLEEVQETLEAGDVLVLYGLCLDEALALVVGREEARVVALGERADVEAACEALDTRDRDADPTAALAALRRTLVEPLGLEAGTKRLIVSPAGRLALLPFGALFDVPVAVTPSGSTQALLLEEERGRGEGILALGDPDYAGATAGTSAALYRGRSLVALPATRVEAESIATAGALLGARASEAGLREALAANERWRAVHLACHGLVDGKRPLQSSLALTRTGDDDGFLTAQEVLSTRIASDLVTLSACETATGEVVQGEGIVGLTRAFMYAGSPRVLCSLWKVDDEATSALMRKFYDLWNPKTGSTGLGTAEALRQAQEHVRSQAKWKHPYYWAAWVLWGLPS